jgi:23S rRNA (cytosine1962-C5)-methyltransferase
VEDAVKFVRREVKRGKKYQGIILDPPAFGHGPDGESWVLEKQINELLKEVFQLLDREEHFLIINTYSLGFSSIILENLMMRISRDMDFPIKPEAGEIYLPAKSGVKLPLGVYCRFGNR